MPVDIRLIDESEHVEWAAQLGRAFFQHPAEGLSAYYWSTEEPGRARGAFDGSSIVGSLRSFGTDLTVPGPQEIRASALTAVSVAATHRRQGVLTRMITEDLHDSKERGEPVSILLASEYPIYSRFGYGPATECATYEVATRDLHFLRPSVGTFEYVDLATLRKDAPPIYDRVRNAQPGFIERDGPWWDRLTRQVEVPGAEPWKGFQAVYTSEAGELEGYVLYEGKPDWSATPAGGTLTIVDMVAATPEAYQALWEFCFNVDLLNRTVAPTRAPDEILPLLVDDARKMWRSSQTDFLWVRVLDTEVVLASRRYLDDGSLVLDVRDDHGLASGRFELEVDGSGVTCRSTKKSPQITTTVQALGSAYLGGVTWSRLALAGRAEEMVSGALPLADRMFATPRAPWCSTFF